MQQRNSLRLLGVTMCFEKEMEYLDSLAILLLALSLLGILFVLAIGIIFTRNLNTPVVKSSGECVVCYVILFCPFLLFAGTGFSLENHKASQVKPGRHYLAWAFSLHRHHSDEVPENSAGLSLWSPTATFLKCCYKPIPIIFHLQAAWLAPLHSLAHPCSPCCGTNVSLPKSYLWMWGEVHSCIWLHAGLYCHPGLHVLHLCLQRQEITWQLQWGQIHNIWHAHCFIAWITFIPIYHVWQIYAGCRDHHYFNI